MQCREIYVYFNNATMSRKWAWIMLIKRCSSLAKYQRSTTFRCDCFKKMIQLIISGVISWAKAAQGKNSWMIQYKYPVFWSLHCLASPSKAKLLLSRGKCQENKRESVLASASTTTKIYPAWPVTSVDILHRYHKKNVWGSAF